MIVPATVGKSPCPEETHDPLHGGTCLSIRRLSHLIHQAFEIRFRVEEQSNQGQHLRGAKPSNVAAKQFCAGEFHEDARRYWGSAEGRLP